MECSYPADGYRICPLAGLHKVEHAVLVVLPSEGYIAAGRRIRRMVQIRGVHIDDMHRQAVTSDAGGIPIVQLHALNLVRRAHPFAVGVVGGAVEEETIIIADRMIGRILRL